jgi:hypothetical protein
MKTLGFKFDKPVRKKRGTRITKDGRLIESNSDYRKTKRQMWEGQLGICGKEDCNLYMPTPQDGHRHHPGGRGMGGSKRDDSKTVLWCELCHTKEHQ